MADTLEVLAVDKDKHLVLYGPEGATLWRKRPFPGMIGRISASGEYFAFVTSDPAIVGTDRSLRVNWAYRNLMKRPADLAISADGKITCFPCSDDRGDGVASVNQAGRPFDPFLGMKALVAVDISEDGQQVLALDRAGGLYCVNPIKGYGIWKGKSSPRNSGVSFASQTGDSIVYSDQGRIIKFDAKGNQIWEYSFPERLLKAYICPDSQAIYYATERGEIGCLRRNSGEVVNQMEFMEKQVEEKAAKNPHYFRKIWSVELNADRDHKPLVCCWLGHEGVEYSVVWNGKDSLLCLNDLGEEVWEQRLGAVGVKALSAHADADMVVALTQSGVLGFDIDGNESFRFFGSFLDVHVFADSSMLLVDDKCGARFYQSYEHFSHVIESPEAVSRLVPVDDELIIVRQKQLQLINFKGDIVAEYNAASSITHAEVSADQSLIIIGEESGQIQILDTALKEAFNYKLPGPVGLAAFVPETKDIFAAVKGSQEIIILRRRTNELLKTSLTGNPVNAVKHNAGMIIGTDLDQLGLISYEGNILGRYTCPDRVNGFVGCRRQGCFMLLSDDALCCVAAVIDTRTAERSNNK